MLEKNKEEIDLDAIITSEIIQKWQNIVNILAEMSDVPAALIMRVEKPYIEVFRSSETENNPYEVGSKEELTGLYCERVINTEKKLLVKNALKSEDWKENPDIDLGMISYLGYPIELPNKQIFGTICILDKKERTFNRNIEKLMVQFKELVELHIDLAYKNLRVKRTLKREEFFRDLISHDINNILQNVRSSTELLKGKLPKIQSGDSINEILEILDSQVLSGKRLIDNTKIISFLEEGKQDLDKVDFCEYLNEVRKDIIDGFKVTRKVEIDVLTEEKELYVLANEYLRDILENILLHAIRNNTNEIVKINIEVTVMEKNQRDYLKAMFNDNAIGFSDEEKEIIFQKDSYTKHKEKGMEIGLEVTQRLIELYNGEIHVENRVEGKPSKGSIFTILLPLA